MSGALGQLIDVNGLAYAACELDYPTSSLSMKHSRCLALSAALARALRRTPKAHEATLKRALRARTTTSFLALRAPPGPPPMRRRHMADTARWALLASYPRQPNSAPADADSVGLSPGSVRWNASKWHAEARPEPVTEGGSGHSASSWSIAVAVGAVIVPNAVYD
ncbi:hypothetical protein CERSUDRAFT_97590 [Gelatoporia subvermispora B]|uniref:Uncharacterized protein n=1 Tax=Ceriporiopsis subvermispora (strain B) TaxID=914234 RepID=M2R607_CERS8|nr:hypothetical protein CERSUDRAFT_97590 [Gelatoporia subvermispora B]